LDTPRQTPMRIQLSYTRDHFIKLFDLGSQIGRNKIESFNKSINVCLDITDSFENDHGRFN
jgi:hypothetical protein